MLGAVIRRGCGAAPSSLGLWPISQLHRVGSVVGDCGKGSLAPLSKACGVDQGRGFGTRGFEGGIWGLGAGSNSVWGLMEEEWIRRPTLGMCGQGLTSGWSQSSQVRGFIQLKTNLEVADNSGARRVQCIKVMKGSNAAKIGDIIMASVKDAQPRGKVKKGEVVTCVVVRAATQKLRRDGSEIKFDKNAVVLVNKQGEPLGTRIFGPVPHELRRRKLVKILTLAEHVA